MQPKPVLAERALIAREYTVANAPSRVSVWRIPRDDSFPASTRLYRNPVKFALIQTGC